MTVNVRMEGLLELALALKAFRPAVRRASKLMLIKMTREYMRDIRKRYRSRYGNPSGMTQRKRAYGKWAGAPGPYSAAVPRYPPVPLFRITGALINAAELLPARGSGPTTLARLVVGVKDRHLAGVAVLNEQGRKWTFFPTPRAWRYIMVLAYGRRRQKQAGGAKEGYPPLWSPPGINITIPSRPIWEPALTAVFAKTATIFQPLLARELGRLPFFKMGRGASATPKAAASLPAGFASAAARIRGGGPFAPVPAVAPGAPTVPIGRRGRG